MKSLDTTRKQAVARSVSQEFYSETELSIVANIAVKTLRNWRLLRKGPPAYRFGGLVRYSIPEYQRWAEAQRCGGQVAR